MWAPAVVLACVLDVMGRSADSLPPIVLLDARPQEVSARAEAFTRDGDSRIYILTTGDAFVRASSARDRCSDYDALRYLAGVVAHEEWHVRHGLDERGAYQAQLTTLQRLNAGPGSPAYTAVMRSMRLVMSEMERARHVRARLAESRARTTASMHQWHLQVTQFGASWAGWPLTAGVDTVR